MDAPVVSVVVPTRDRAEYLEVTLESLTGQIADCHRELLVVDDGSGDATPEVAAQAGVRCVSHGRPRGLNVARNTGIRESSAPLIAFIDDDVLAPPNWLHELVK